ncbi:MAG: electron transfer flavoprotein subunit alpha/FixB family protein [Deltaproteobacteria bacterium]|nr:electron transfer flavoprotein subunit alpha/FixB family protein [Deltaproteobacteria bacterium]
MSYGLIVADVRKGTFDERNLDLIGFCNILEVDAYILLPKGDYDVDLSYFKRVIRLNMEEADFLNPLNIGAIVEKTIEKFGRPSIIIFSSSSSGMEMASYLAGYFNVPIITDINGLSKEEKVFFKSCYSEKVYAHLRLKNEGFSVLTIRSGSFKQHANKKCEVTETEEMDPPTLSEKRSFLGYVEEEKQEIDITKANFLISIGRGVGKKEEIAGYEELATLLKATLSASRPVIDKQWLPKERQVGTSGKTVKPKVYLAMGISGAFQHIAGMKDSECIIAVNKDPEAPIFQYAHYGIIGDMHKVRDKLKELLKGL